MNSHAHNVAGRLSLRPPQILSLERLARVCELAPPRKGADPAAVLAAVRVEYPQVTDFEREFPSLCFALATGVGKTRLMGAFVSFLYLAHGVRNFFVLAPNLTIYNKLIADFTPNTPKYVFRGLTDFAIKAPTVITGDNYEQLAGNLYAQPDDCTVNIFNISKINSEVRGGKSPRIKRLSEYIGESYFEYLAKLPDLVLLMDESHRYRAGAGVRAINELKPVLGLELTATPFVETARGAAPFKNVIVDYPLAQAMADGFVKEPAVVTRQDFNPAGMTAEEVERLKLEDGVRLHESLKAELETYAHNSGRPVVKPFVLVIARDTTHAKELLAAVEADAFFGGRYKGRAIQVDSSQTGAKEEEMIARLLKVESAAEPTEIVIHVNMLKEGWDVTNLYTIVPLRAANARVLVEQSIGRGLRLPYGERTGVSAVDRLNIIAHDKFQEILDDAKRPDSPFRLHQLVLDPAGFAEKTVSVVSKSRVAEDLFAEPAPAAAGGPPPLFATAGERKAAQVAYEVLRTFENRPDAAPTVAALGRADVQATVVAEVRRRLGPQQQDIFKDGETLAAVVAKTTSHVVRGTIDIPRITLVPTAEVKSGITPFTLDVSALRYETPSDELVGQFLRTGEQERYALGRAEADYTRLEDYVVNGLRDFDDLSYEDHADLINDLAAQAVAHLKAKCPDERDLRKVLRIHQTPIAAAVHAQMMAHFWEEETAGYEAKVSKGFTELKESAYTANAADTVLDYRQPPADKGKIAQYLYSGFERCLFRLTKFQSDTERVVAVILERGAERWFRPARGQFQIFYKLGPDHREYQPDFVAETAAAVLMIEPKKKSEMADPEVLAKRDAAVQWCRHASAHAARHGGKPWRYVLIPHDAVAENMTLAGLAAQYATGE